MARAHSTSQISDILNRHKTTAHFVLSQQDLIHKPTPPLPWQFLHDRLCSNPYLDPNGRIEPEWQEKIRKILKLQILALVPGVSDIYLEHLAKTPLPARVRGRVLKAAGDRIIAHAPDLKSAVSLTQILAGFHIHPKKSKLLLLHEVLLRESRQRWELRTLGHLAEERSGGPVSADSYYYGYQKESSAIEALRKALCTSKGYPRQSPEAIELAITRIWIFCRLFGPERVGSVNQDCEMRWFAGQKCPCPEHLPSFGVGNAAGLTKNDMLIMIVTWGHLKQLLRMVISSLPYISGTRNTTGAQSIVMEEFLEFALPYSIGWLGEGLDDPKTNSSTSLPWLDDLFTKYVAARRIERWRQSESYDMLQRTNFFETLATMFLKLYAIDQSGS
jgi:hypothetical protein